MKYTSDLVLLYHGRFNTSVVLVERRWDPFAGKLALPGGFVEPGETHLDAAVREMFEETGLAVRPQDLRFVRRYDKAGRDPRGPVVTEAFVVEVDHMMEPTAADDARDARWWLVDEAQRLGLAFDHEQILRDAIEAEERVA